MADATVAATPATTPAATPTPAAAAVAAVPAATPAKAADGDGQATPTLLGGAADPATAAKPATDPKAATDPAKPEGAPEKYDFKPPEGVTYAPEMLTKFEGLARAANLPQTKANELLGLASEFAQSTAKQQAEAFAQQVVQWGNQVKADKEIGGTHFDETARMAQTAVRELGTPELQRALNETGMGNHPELVRVFARIGKAMQDGKWVRAGADSAQPKSNAERLYGRGENEPAIKTG